MSKEPEITYNYDDDAGMVVFFADGEEVCAWNCEDEEGLQYAVLDFETIYNLGKRAGGCGGNCNHGD